MRAYVGSRGCQVQEPQRARIILSKARGEGDARTPASSTQRVWMKSAMVRFASLRHVPRSDSIPTAYATT